METSNQFSILRTRLAEIMCKLENKEIDTKTARKETTLINKEITGLAKSLKEEKKNGPVPPQKS